MLLNLDGLFGCSIYKQPVCNLLLSVLWQSSSSSSSVYIQMNNPSSFREGWRVYMFLLLGVLCWYWGKSEPFNLTLLFLFCCILSSAYLPYGWMYGTWILLLMCFNGDLLPLQLHLGHFTLVSPLLILGQIWAVPVISDALWVFFCTTLEWLWWLNFPVRELLQCSISGADPWDILFCLLLT